MGLCGLRLADAIWKERGMNKIIIGIDSRKPCGHAVHAASKLSLSMGARLEVVHAVDVPRPLWPGIDSLKLASMNAGALAQAWKRELAFLRQELKEHNGRALESILHVQPGNPAQVLCRHAQETNADVLVLGEHSSRNLLDFGSTVRSCLAKATCSVLIQRYPWKNLERILVPVDMSGESASALRIALQIAKSFGARVQILHCFSTPTLAAAGSGYYPEMAIPFPLEKVRKVTEDEFRNFVAEQDTYDVDVVSSFEDASPRRGILDKSEQVDLIVMGTHGRTGLARAVLGSVAYSVIHDAKTPVLAVPLPRREWLL